MALTFTTSDEVSHINGVKILVYGPSGIGKTSLIATMPDPVALSVEKGLLSLNAANQKAIFGRAINVPVIEISSFVDLHEAYRFISESAHAKALNPCIDSLSDIAEVVLANAKASVKDPRKAYGDLVDRMTDLIRKFRDLPGRHVYMTAKQDREKDEASNMVLYGPSMPGKNLTNGVAHFFDEVFAMGVSPKQANGSTYRFLRTQADIQFQAKDRSGALDEIEQPNLGIIISKIQNHVSTK